MKNSITLLLFLIANLSFAQDWQIENTRSILKENPKSYSDNIEMAGKKVAGIIHYEIDSLGMLAVDREIIFPQLRRHIKENVSKWRIYRGYLQDNFDDDFLPEVYVGDKRFVPAAVQHIRINGILEFQHHTSKLGLQLIRHFYPSTTQRAFIEKWELVNQTDSIVQIQVGHTNFSKKDFGVYGKYSRNIKSTGRESIKILPKKSHTFNIEITAYKESEIVDVMKKTKSVNEHQQRKKLINDIHANLNLITPEPVLNTLFEFSKIRAAENIFDSKMGIVHSPGGGRYYTGVWANDQAEYSGPFFPYLGLEDGNVAALNAYKKFYEQMKTIPNHDKNLWASYEMNGEITCCGTDRGDAAMIAYGGLHYLLAMGDTKLGAAYEPMIDWCLTYSHKKLNNEGVVLSESDEMEERIPTGDANLSTSSLYYGALELAIPFYEALGADVNKVNTLKKRRDNLRIAIEKYFGAKVEGLNTYKYYKEHKFLRHWICLPLVVGIDDRIEGTTEALFERLWTENGVHVEKNSDNPDISKIFWDRGTLYALRGTLIAGKTEISLNKLLAFSKKRLIGDHVPYVVEAYPEGNMAHLSAESALYCRVLTEGLFGILPTGFDQFKMTPRLPKEWNQMALEKVQAFDQNFDIHIKRISNKKINVRVSNQKNKEIYNKTITNGDTVVVNFN